MVAQARAPTRIWTPIPTTTCPRRSRPLRTCLPSPNARWHPLPCRLPRLPRRWGWRLSASTGCVTWIPRRAVSKSVVSRTARNEIGCGRCWPKFVRRAVQRVLDRATRQCNWTHTPRLCLCCSRCSLDFSRLLSALSTSLSLLFLDRSERDRLPPRRPHRPVVGGHVVDLAGRKVKP